MLLLCQRPTLRYEVTPLPHRPTRNAGNMNCSRCRPTVGSWTKVGTSKAPAVCRPCALCGWQLGKMALAAHCRSSAAQAAAEASLQRAGSGVSPTFSACDALCSAGKGRRRFTLIERVPSKAPRTSRLKCADPANFPFRAGSLTTGAGGDAPCQSVVTKSREGEFRESGATRSQSERRGKDTGRRKTNDRRHRKGDPAVVADRAGYFRVRRASVLCAKSAEHREASGSEHLCARRCKRRRHVSKAIGCNWGDPIPFQSNTELKRP